MRKLVSGIVPIVFVACLLSIVGASPAQAHSPKKKGRGVLEVVCVDRGDGSLRAPSRGCAKGEDRVRVSVAERLRVRRGLVVPSNEGAWFCARPGRGVLREIDRPAQCKKGRALESRNHRPGAPALSDTEVPENVPVGTAVGALTAADRDTADRMTFRLVGGDTDTFKVVDGALVTAAPLDFETRAAYRVRIRVTDLLGLSRAAAYDIAVTDAQENRPPTGVSLDGSGVEENQPAGTLVGRLDSADPDTGDTHVYTLVTAPGVANDNPLFSIAGDELRTVAPFDFEEQSQLSIRVRTDDGAGGSFEKDLTVAVSDAPDAPTGIALAPGTISENRTGEVGRLTAEDQDAGEQHAFSLVQGDGDRDNAMFAVSGDRLSLASAADFESRSALTARVRVTDKDGLTYDQAVSVSVTNVAEAPTGVSLSPASVPENEPARTRVGTLTISDPDGADGARFELVTGAGSDDNAAFRIEGIALVTDESFDYEADASKTIRVRGTDSTGMSVESALTVTVVNKNESPTRLDLSSTEVDEDAEIGTVVGTLSTDDPDLDDPITYTLTDDAGGTFAVDGDELVTAADLDSEVATSHTVEVRAEDADGESVEAAFVISVVDINDAPSAPSINDDTVEENLAPGATVGELTASDPDGGDTLSYALVAGDGDDGNAAFAVSGTTLVTAERFDFEATPSYSIRVRVTDSGTPARSTDAVLTIHVADVNEAPSAPTLSPSSIAENQEPGTLVGALSATDPDAGDTLTYSLVDGADSASFSVVAGRVYALESFDFEDVDSYTIEVEVTDGDETASATLTVTVTDANDAPADIALSSATVAENAAAGPIGTLSTTDEDAGDSHEYTLPDGQADNDDFALLGDVLRATGPFDHETQPTREVLVRSTDEAGAYVERTLTVTVTNVNEAPTSISLTPAAHFWENVATQAAGTLSAADPEGGAMTYALVSGTGDADNDSFEIDGTTLRATAAFDYETQPTASVRVQVTDGGGLSHTQALTVTVEDVDDPPTGIMFRSGGSVVENAPAGSAVGSLDVVDVDGSDEIEFHLVDNTATFELDVDGSMRTRGPLDHESTPEITVTVRVEDGLGDTLYTGPVTVTVTDLNEAPTRVDLSSTSVDENEPAGTPVGTLSAADEDAEVGDPTFQLVSGGAQFKIVGAELLTTASFDYETTSSYSITVRATDAGGLSVQTPITITVGQVNEEPSITGAASFPVSENRAVGTTVATLAATDPESDTLSWSLVSGTGSTDNAKFTITAAGELKTAASFDYETQSTLHARVRVSDGKLSDERELTVLVQDENDAPVAVDDSFTGAIGNTAGRAGAATVPGSTAYTGLTGQLPLTNDHDQDGDPLTVVPRSNGATDFGGTVDLDADGNFMYYPPKGVKNETDRFYYQVRDDAGATATGWVTVAITDRRVWYVGSAGGALTPNGTSRAPYTDFTALNGGTGDVDGPGDDIFLYGDLTGSIALEQNQRLLGGAAGLPGVTTPSATRPTLTGSGGFAVALANGSTVDGVALRATGSNDVVRASAVTTSTVGSNATIEQAGSGTAVSITGAAGGDITIDTAISTSTGRAVTVSNRSSGTVTFAKRVTTSSGALGGVTLTSNTGATIALSAGVTLTSSGAAFAATGGGTVTVPASTPASTLKSTAGAALTVENTSIGASGLNFARIDSNGGLNGIRLVKTGTSGSLTVTGSSAGVCGGGVTATGTSSSNPDPTDCTGGSITASTGSGIWLDNTKAPSLTRLRVATSADDGITARNVTGGLTLARSYVVDNGNALDDNGVDLGGSDSTAYQGVTGVVAITDTTISGSADSNLFSRTRTGTTTLTLLRNRILAAGTVGGARDGVRAEIPGGTVDLTVSGTMLEGNKGDHVQVSATGAGVVSSATVSSSTMSQGTGWNSRAVVIGAGGSPWTGTIAYNVNANRISGSTGPAVVVATSNGTASVGAQGHLRNNVIGVDGVAGSCSTTGHGIRLSNEGGSGQLRASVVGNTVRGCAGNGVDADAGAGATASLIMTGNTIDRQVAGRHAVALDLGTDATDQGRTSCLNVSGNTLTGSPTALNLRHDYGVLQVVDPAPASPYDAAKVQTSLAAQNSSATVLADTTIQGSYVAVASCPSPSNPA